MTFSGPLQPTQPVRRAVRLRWRGAEGGDPPLMRPSTIRPITSPRRLPAGRAIVATALPRIVPPIQSHPWLSVVGGQPRRRGRLVFPPAYAPALPPIQSHVWHPAQGGQPRRRGTILPFKPAPFPDPGSSYFGSGSLRPYSRPITGQAAWLLYG